jgi:hypothetical protein
MKNLKSWLACVLISMVLIFYRYQHTELHTTIPLKVTTWDAFGYYLFLPGTFIYDDIKQYNWVDTIEEEYQVQGSSFYQVEKAPNGNLVGKYTIGVSILESPWFALGHIVAKNSRFKADGFSAPYQYCIAFGAVVYCILALFLLRKVLLRYYSDEVSAIALLLLICATNAIQYISIDSAQSHSYIFPLYAMVLYFTLKWHEKPSLKWAGAIGFTIGLATICRPTELIMLFIPLFWGANNKSQWKAKWKLILKYKRHLIVLLFLCFLGAFPQLLYWKYTTGSFFYEMGSKWYFLNPFFRVLFGFTNGWFIYTPITLLFVIGLFLIKRKIFYRSALVFCLLNIWIVIAWSDWRYGGTYSTRALVQSYPVFALAFAEVIRRCLHQKWLKTGFTVFALFCIYLNLFQIKQYYNGVLHFRDMNFAYYQKAFLDLFPTPEEFSLMDNGVFLDNENRYVVSSVYQVDTNILIVAGENKATTVAQVQLSDNTLESEYLKVSFEANSSRGLEPSFFQSKICNSQVNQIRLHRPYAKENQWTEYAYYIPIPKNCTSDQLHFLISTEGKYKGEIRRLKIESYSTP